MYFTAKDVIDLDAERLRAFVDLRIQENQQLDYKEAIYGSKSEDAAHRDFIQDVTGFANAEGGTLFIGIREPAKASASTDPLIGIQDGDSVAVKLERICAASIDPRIPGLLVRSVGLSNGRQVVVAHVPPSVSRPHMVVFQKTRSFYKRHSESTQPMTAHEIRESVLASATAGQQARAYMRDREQDHADYHLQGRPSFLIQVMPLIQPDVFWDTQDVNLHHIVQGRGRNQHGTQELSTNFSPRLTIEGFQAFDNREAPSWMIEVHRNGYMDFVLILDHNDSYTVYSSEGDIFGAFCAFCDNVLDFTKANMPYVVRSKIVHAAQVRFMGAGTYKKVYQPTGRKELVWPEQVRSPGESFLELVPEWTRCLHNAFGAKYEPA